MEAFKERVRVDYSSDVLSNLRFAGTGGNGFEATTEKMKNPREIEPVVLKNRNGRAGNKRAYNYYTLFNFFQERGLLTENHSGITVIEMRLIPAEEPEAVIAMQKYQAIFGRNPLSFTGPFITGAGKDIPDDVTTFIRREAHPQG